jgi:photosystem II stability/assembly factor-like uncharacterized protein
MKKIIVCSLLLSSFLGFSQVKISSATFGNYEARQIGPAVMGGRITAIEAIEKDPRIYYVGTAGGGIWKTTNAGSSFKPIFDKYCQSIGDLKIDQIRPDTIWVGTGESNMRNSVSVGVGIYKTTDGGSNWTKMGLDSTEHISKIQINPNNPDVVYVACPGPLWSDSKHRGLYKTSDGGKTWEKILYTDEKTGCADIVMDPKDPNVLYASMWQFRRTAYSFASGGKGSALYKSTDAGKTWKKIQNGFDGQELGRIILAISPSNTKILYAIAESKNTALYKSTDGGDNWIKKSASQNVTWRPFYFSVIKVDPVNENRIYRPSLGLSFSNDGGETFIEASGDGGWVHSDHHAIWINPKNPTFLLLGTDGGVYQSLDRGNSWTFLNKIPVSQFYHVAIDNQDPYRVMGGLQDNGSWVAPSNNAGGIANRDWDALYYGDGFWVQPDLTDPNVFYAESQGGDLARINQKYNETKSVKPLAVKGDPKLRFNWNTPICLSPNNPKTLYVGSQFLYKSVNKGDTWAKISPDLTTNDPKKQEQEKSGGLSVDNSSAENHCTIFTITEAPGDENNIWVGTDDGNLQVTYDGGKTWKNMIANVSGLPKCTWVSSIDVSKFDKNTVFVTFEGHTTGDMKPYIYKTSDGGKTWKNIANGEIKSFCHKIKQDIISPDILFAGTEMGLFVSLDGGVNWAEWTAGVPKTPVRDIQIHPTTNDVVLATHGRGIIIIDDISPLRKMTKEITESEFAFLPNRQAYIGSEKYSGGFGGLTGEYTAGNASEDAVITYYLKDRFNGDAKMEILDKDGKLITTLPVTKRKGLNKVVWDMRLKAPRVAKAVKLDMSGFFGPLVSEGEYTIRFIKGDKRFETKLNLLYDPKGLYSKEERAAQNDAVMKIFAMQEELAFANEQVMDARDTIKSILKKNPSNKDLQKQLTAFQVKLDACLSEFAAQIEGTNITGEEKLREKIGMLYYQVNSYKGRPTDSQYENMEKLSLELEAAKKKASQVFTTEIEKINTVLEKNKLSKITIVDKETFDKRTKKS